MACSVYAALTAGQPVHGAAKKEILDTFDNAKERGRDSWGLRVIDEEGFIHSQLSVNGEGKPDWMGSNKSHLAIIGSRAQD
jgi:hypothetical protein